MVDGEFCIGFAEGLWILCGALGLLWPRDRVVWGELATRARLVELLQAQQCAHELLRFEVPLPVRQVLLVGTGIEFCYPPA